VLPEKVIDGKAIQIQPTKPTKEYLAWWAEHGERSAAPKDSDVPEDGEAAGEMEEEAKEMEAMEEVMDIITKREQNGGSRSSRKAERDATDRVLDSISRSDQKCALHLSLPEPCACCIWKHFILTNDCLASVAVAYPLPFADARQLYSIRAQ
jgi:hypothetical protein